MDTARPDLQERKQQGTIMHPLKIYKMQNSMQKIDVPYHWHENVEIILMQKGKLTLKIQENDFIGKPGDIFYINPKELHGMQAQTTDCLYFAFVFPLSWIQFAQTDEVEERYLSPLAKENAHVRNHVTPEKAGRAETLLKEIYESYFCESQDSWIEIKARILLFYSYLYQNDQIVCHPRENSKLMYLLLDIAQYIETHHNEKLSLKRMGHEFHMSPKYFSIYFQKHFNRNFSDHLTTIRIEHARKLLTETDSDMELIAHQVGFSGNSYFIRVFRECFGMTPGQYRRLYQK